MEGESEKENYNEREIYKGVIYIYRYTVNERDREREKKGERLGERDIKKERCKKEKEDG